MATKPPPSADPGTAGLRLRAKRVAAHRLHIPPRRYFPYLVPGAPALLRARWAWTVRRAPVMTVEQHAAITGVKEIEEVIGCDLCGGRRIRALFHVRPDMAARKRYHVVLCEGCGFLFRHPGIRPERLGDLYSGGGYGDFLTGHYAAARQRRYRLVLDAFAPLLDDGAGRRLLDFGSGAGLFLELAHARGFDTHGVDLSPDAVELARSRPGAAKSFHGSPRDVPEIAAGGFDVITMWSVMAHLATPMQDLTMLRGLLNDDGVLLVLTVNAGSLVLKEQRATWGAFTPNHLKIYSATTLRRLLALAGFGAVVIRPMLPDHVASGRSRLTDRQVRRMGRVIAAHGNQGGMLRAVAFADPDGPARVGMEREAVALSPAERP